MSNFLNMLAPRPDISLALDDLVSALDTVFKSEEYKKAIDQKARVKHINVLLLNPVCLRWVGRAVRQQQHALNMFIKKDITKVDSLIPLKMAKDACIELVTQLEQYMHDIRKAEAKHHFVIENITQVMGEFSDKYSKIINNLVMVVAIIKRIILSYRYGGEWEKEIPTKYGFSDASECAKALYGDYDKFLDEIEKSHSEKHDIDIEFSNSMQVSINTSRINTSTAYTLKNCKAIMEKTQMSLLKVSSLTSLLNNSDTAIFGISKNAILSSARMQINFMCWMLNEFRENRHFRIETFDLTKHNNYMLRNIQISLVFSIMESTLMAIETLTSGRT